MRLLVTGGAGYVGGVCAAVLLERGHEVVIIDDLSTGNRDGVPPGATFVEGSVIDTVTGVFAEHGPFDGVLHFAAQSLVGESVLDPAKYWHGNVETALALLDAIVASGTPRLVFSSTAATYGEPEITPITEDMPTAPTNTYGATKLAIDAAITGYARAYRFTATSLRYFNVAGAYGGFGENRRVETHLIPLVLQVALAQRQAISVFGTDWPTPDGTAVRDYIHVADLADAHLLALGAGTPGEHRIFNLGSGTGFSVREVIEACRRVTGLPIPSVDTERRAGDPAILVASSAKAIAELGWQPTRTDLDEVVADAWEFTRALGSRSHAAHPASV